MTDNKLKELNEKVEKHRQKFAEIREEIGNLLKVVSFLEKESAKELEELNKLYD